MYQEVEKGFLRANPYAEKSFVEIAKDKADYPYTIGEDSGSGTVASARLVAAIEHEGETYTFDNQVAVSSTLDVERLIVAHLESHPTMAEGNVLVNVSYDGTILSVSHEGATTISKVIFDDASELVLTRKIAKVAVCDYHTSIIGAAGELKYDSNTAALGTYAFTAGDSVANDAVAATIKADVEAAATTVGLMQYEVEVTVNDLAEDFLLKIVAKKGSSIMVAAKFLQALNCRVQYV